MDPRIFGESFIHLVEKEDSIGWISQTLQLDWWYLNSLCFCYSEFQVDRHYQVALRVFPSEIFTTRNLKILCGCVSTLYFFQWRYYGSLDFHRTWNECVQDFGEYSFIYTVKFIADAFKQEYVIIGSRQYKFLHQE